jgi:hypothetical protein
MNLRNTLAVIRADKLKLTAALSVLAIVVAGGVTLGSWTVSGTGTGYAKAVTPQDLILHDATADTVADLYPGQNNGTVVVKVENPNPFDVTITDVTLDGGGGPITSDVGGACDAATGVTFVPQNGLSLSLPAGATTSFTLAGAATMDNTSDPACESAVFHIPVQVAATT